MATEAEIGETQAKIAHIHLMIREAWMQQAKHSGVVHAELSAILPAIEALTEIVTAIAVPLAATAQAELERKVALVAAWRDLYGSDPVLPEKWG